MASENPVPFREALQYRDIKELMPTSMGSAELARLEAAVRERAMFSARTMNEQYLQAIAERVRALLGDEGLNQATARLELKQILREIGYEAEPGEEGTIKDLSSDARINLVLETNVEMAQGYGQWIQGQDPELLDFYPAQELFRAEARKEERPWKSVIWPEAARAVGDTGALSALRFGRMVARKDSPIWEHISDFGQPYPPFKFNSGMDVMDVDREEAVRLGVITADAVVQPQSRGFELEAA